MRHRLAIGVEYLTQPGNLKDTELRTFPSPPHLPLEAK
jgi:hypothetical protein